MITTALRAVVNVHTATWLDIYYKICIENLRILVEI